jgi:hypothetical protein
VGPACTAQGERVAGLPWALLTTRLLNRTVADGAESFVVALAMVAGLKSHLLSATNSATADYVGALSQRLPDNLRQVVVAVEAALAREVLVQRR